MSTTATENQKLGQEMSKQEERIKEMKLSGEQQEFRMQNAQDVLKQLQIVLKEGEVPGTEFINDVLLKAEQFLVKQAQTTQVDPETRKCLEDIALLVGSAKQMARHKDLGDRLQRIAEETSKAMQEAGKPGVSPQAREATLEAVNIIQNWRPLFELLVSSREFRVLVVDTIKIFRQILLRHKGDVPEKVEQQFISGQSPAQIAQNVTEEAKESFQTPQGDVQVKISDEEFDAFYEDIARVLITLAKTPSYREGIDRMFHLFDILRNQLSSSGVSENIQPHARRAQVETEELLASFAGHTTLNNFITSLRKLTEKVNKDLKTRQYLTELRNFILDTKTAEKLHEKETKEQLKKFSREGRELVYQFKYANELNDFLDKSDKLVENIKNDEFVSVLRHHAALVANDISYVDNQGIVQMDTEMLGKLRSVIAPVIAESLKYIPIPRIEDNDENRHFWVDNIVLCGYDVIPDNIRIQMESDSSINIREIQSDHSHTRLLITLNNIRTELKNLDFYYHKKTFPQLTENGKVTLRLPGAGATLFIAFFVEQTLGTAVPIFRQGNVSFQIHEFDIEFDKQTLTHDILVPMITSMFKYNIQRQIELSVEKNIGGLVNGIGERLTNALVDVNRPLMQGMEQLRQTVKSTEVASVFEKRRQKLE